MGPINVTNETNMKSNKLINVTKSKRFSKLVEANLIRHHELYSSYPIAKELEEIFARCLYEHTPKQKVQWLIGGHQSGYDIIGYGEDISIKSMTYNTTRANTNITISSHRTTKFKTIDEKYDFLCEGHESCTLGIAHSTEVYNTFTKYTYRIVLIDALPFSELEPHKWTTHYTKKGKLAKWTTTYDNIKFDIMCACSDQLWITVPYNSPYVTELNKIELCVDTRPYIATGSNTSLKEHIKIQIDDNKSIFDEFFKF